MAKVVAPINARVEVIGKVKQGEYGPYRSVLFIDESQLEGSQAGKLWKSFNDDDQTVSQLSKRSRVQLVPAGKDKLTFCKIAEGFIKVFPLNLD